MYQSCILYNDTSSKSNNHFRPKHGLGSKQFARTDTCITRLPIHLAARESLRLTGLNKSPSSLFVGATAGVPLKIITLAQADREARRSDGLNT